LDDRHVEVPGAKDVELVLASDPLFRVLGFRLASPWVLGAVIGFLIVLMILLGPSIDSHFIYTDF